MLLERFEDRAREYGIGRLSRESGVSKAYIYRIFKGESSPTLGKLDSLLSIIGLGLKLEERPREELRLTRRDELRLAMTYYGAPLVISKEVLREHESKKIPALNKTLLYALKCGRTEVDINTVLPFFIHNNREVIDFKTIIAEFSDHQYLGYLLNLLYAITGDGRYQIYIAMLDIAESSLRKTYLIKGGSDTKFKRDRYNRTNNPIADTWKFRTSDSLKSLTGRFNKWSGYDLH